MLAALFYLLVGGSVLFAAAASAATYSAPLAVTANPVVMVNPSSVVLSCEARPGTVISTGTLIGGSGAPITWSMTPADASYSIGTNTGVVTVASGGVLPADCTGNVTTFSISATQ